MTHYVLPDNTVLVNFTHIDRHDLVEWFARGQGAWALTVSRECEQSARMPGLERMRKWGAVFGAAWIPEPAETLDAHLIAERMRKPGETQPGKHMGEAETVAIVTRRRLQVAFLTDDFDAARVARAHQIRVVSTTHIIAMAEAANRITHEEAHRYLDDLQQHKRVLGKPPSLTGYDAYVARLRSPKR